MTDSQATPDRPRLRDRLFNALVAVIAVPYVALLCLKVAWGWFRFILWVHSDPHGRSDVQENARKRSPSSDT